MTSSDTGADSGSEDSNNNKARIELLIDALTDEGHVLSSDLENLRQSAGTEPHVVTQLTETLWRMLYLAESLAGKSPGDDTGET